MTIRRSSYDTTIGIGIVTKQIEHAIKEAFIKDRIQETHLDLITSLNYRPVFITGSYSSESNIPFFAHPILIDHVKGENFMCIDIRPFVRSNETLGTGEISIRNQTEYNFMMNRAIMNMAWITGSANQIKSSLMFAGTIYAAWLSEAISKRYALDPKDQLTLTVITHYYYQSLFYPEDSFEEDTIQKFAVHTIKASRAPAPLVFEIFDKIGPMKTLEDYCENVKKILENIRLEDFSVGMLITVIGNTWFGLNAKEILAVALEHPPTWVAIVQSALTERTFKNSQIAKIADRFGKSQSITEFMQGFANITAMLTQEKNTRPSFRSFD